MPSALASAAGLTAQSAIGTNHQRMGNLMLLLRR
jgi:hypothetical protein